MHKQSQNNALYPGVPANSLKLDPVLFSEVTNNMFQETRAETSRQSTRGSEFSKVRALISA